eukprot:362535-Chlamydomonas_euryale.AAC.4
MIAAQPTHRGTTDTHGATVTPGTTQLALNSSSPDSASSTASSASSRNSSARGDSADNGPCPASSSRLAQRVRWPDSTDDAPTPTARPRGGCGKEGTVGGRKLVAGSCCCVMALSTRPG